MGNLPRFSVNRPVFATMIFLIIVVLGIFAFFKLKIDLLPNIEQPTLSIRTGYEGASPEVMENQVTQIIEEIIGTVPGVEELRSSSSEGRSEVTVQFGWGTDIDSAALELQARVEDEINELPDDVTRPRVRKYDVNNLPIVILGVSSQLSPVDMTRLVEEEIRHEFARVPGVSQVDTFGAYYPEVRVEVDPGRLQALGISLDLVLQAIRNSNLDLPSGQIESGRYEVNLRAPSQFESIDEIRETVIDNVDGAPVMIGQIAEVVETHERMNSYDRINGELGLRFGIRKEASANTVEVARGVLNEIERINKEYPQLKIVPILNQGNFIELSIANVARSVLYGGVLAILVLLFFLRNLRTTAIIAVAIPISIIATFALMYFGGLTINLMTLGGLALGVGMMVDSSIVVLENIFRRRNELGEVPKVAAAEGAREVGGAILASTLTTLVIFIPLVFTEGVTSQLFRDLAFVIVFSLLCSLFVSLSLVPMLCSVFLKNGESSSEEVNSNHPGWIKNAEKAFTTIQSGYQKLIAFVLDRKVVFALLTLVLFVGSILLRPLIGTELLPPSDESRIDIDGEMESGTRLEIVNEISLELERMITEAVPEIQAKYAEAEGGEMEVRLSLVPVNERTRSSEEIAESLRQLLENKAPGMEIRVRARKGQFVLSRLLSSGEGIDVEITGYNLETLKLLAEEVAEVVRDIPGVADVRTENREGNLQNRIQIDRAKVADLGLSVRDVSSVLRTAIAGSDAGDFYREGYGRRILVQLRDAERLSMEDVLSLTLTTPEGELVALSNLVTVTQGRAPDRIIRKEQRRITRVDVNVADRAPGSVAKEIEARLEQLPQPEGYSMKVAGSFEEQEESFQQLAAALILALVLVYMVLACQYESFRDPLIVMTAAPLALIGVVLTLLLTGTTFNLQSGIGCIMLAGIVVNNSILLVDQAGHLLREGLNAREAVVEAGRRRLRPILMTTLTTMLGLMPLALGIGEGADAQAPLARAVIGGLTASTVVTLLLAPMIYYWVHSKTSEA